MALNFKRLIYQACFVFLSSGLFLSPNVFAEEGGGFIDVHMHVDGVQKPSMDMKQGPDHLNDVDLSNLPPPARRKMMMKRRQMMAKKGKRSQGGSTSSADHLIDMMNQYGVEKAIVMPPPQNPNQKGGYDYSALLETVEKYPERLYLGAGGGILNPMIHSISAGDVTEAVRSEFREQAEKMIAEGAYVFAEMTAMHVCMNPKHHYVAAAPDHPLFLLLADIAAKHDVPIDLHMESIPEDMATPKELLNACEKNPKTLPATLPAFERLLEHNRDARIVWQHIGWDNTGYMTPNILGRMLDLHPNLFLAIKAVEKGGPNQQYNFLFDDKRNVNHDWLEFFKSYDDRIVVGADEFARAQGLQGGYRKPPFFQMTWEGISNLPEDLQRKLGRENAERIYRMKY